ncbi:MAG: DUF4445 domain-containing protein [Clostridiales bacterium]|nr:DUF4445 domain-containing protein [Clostridiales bacterium]
MIIKFNRTGVTLAEALADEGYPLELPCGGHGKCGKCRINASGALSDDPNVPSTLQNWKSVLACHIYCGGDVSVEIADNTSKTIASAISGKYAAVDIGTTTIEAVLCDDSGNVISSASMLNPQRRFGADVITRIEAAAEHSHELTNELRAAVNQLLAELSSTQSETVVVTGNTVMLHFFAGLDVSGMATFPFTPVSRFGETVRGLINAGEVYLPSCISAFIGADTTCAIIGAEPKSDESCFIVDIGTNGEMALIKDNRIICASTAAGPALEGAEISAGMQAKPGAINRVHFDGERLICSTIDDKPAIGICGSGFISAAAALLDAGIVDESGYLAEPIELANGVYVTPEDIRKLQLAKSAIRAGIDTLLDGVIPDRFCIAGNFGSHLDLNSCRRIGLIPNNCGKVEILGNSALSGAVKLLEPASRKICEQLAVQAETISLDDNDRFCELYIENMLF